MISRRYSIFVMVLLAALIVFALPENALSAMKFVKLAEKEKDNFNLSLVYKTYDFILPLWISPQEYALHFPKESKYRPLGKTVPKKVVAYYDLKTNTPKPPTLKRILIYIMGFLLEVIVGSILVISVIVGFVKGLKKYLEIRGKLNAAITRYTEKGGKDNAILKILNYLKRKQKRDLYVCFQCDNQLPNQEKVVIEGVTVHIPFSTFLPKNLVDLEKEIVHELNKSFSKIISNDIFRFIKVGQRKTNSVFFDIKYSVSPKEGVYSYEGKRDEGFGGINVNWDIKIFLKREELKKLNFNSTPADRFSVPQGSTIKEIFDKMALTAFWDLNNKLQSKMNLDVL